MQDHEPSSSGESHDHSPEQFFQFLARTEKHIFFTTKWKYIDSSTPDDILDEVAMRVEDNEEYRLAHNIFCGLPKKSRLVYAFHYGGGLSVAEIARLHNTTEDKIKSSLKRIRHLLGSKDIHAMMIRFAETELRFAEEKFRDMTVDLMQKHGIDPAAVYGATQAVDPSVMPALMDFTSHSLNQIAENLGVEAPLLVQTAVAGTATASTAVATAVTNKSFSAFFMVFALPVVWVLAFIISGKLWGAAAIKSTPSVNVKRWLVKQMFVGYCLMLTIPITFLVCTAVLFFIVSEIDEQVLYFSCCSFFGILAASCVIYLMRIHSRYQSIKSSDEKKETMDFSQLEHLIRRGFKVLTILLLACITLVVGEYLISDVIHFFRSERYDQGILALCIFGFLGVATISVHHGMNHYFRYYLTLCHNETSVRSKSSKMDSFLGSIQGELYYMPFFVTIPIGANFIHIFGTRTHTLGSLMELFLFFPWWCLVLWQNVKQPKNRWYWLAGSLMIQVGIMAYLRFTIYK